MPVIRVGFVLGQVGWIGGVNYFRNLFTAIQSIPDTKIRPVVFSGLKSDVSAFEGLAEIIRTPILDRYTLSWWTSKFLSKVFPRRDYLLYWFMRNHRINLLSHLGRLWQGCSIPSLGWIPDFQHMHLPAFFGKQACANGDAQFMDILHRCDAVILSSQDALNDLNKFCPTNTTPTNILRFVSSFDQIQKAMPSRAELAVRYKLDRPWFHISNQFWEHKNHRVVVEALHLLTCHAKGPLVIATGSINDKRNTLYFPSLMKQVNDYGLQDDFRILGLLPYLDVAALMRYSIAIINPSLFEGWNTSVEEAKALGKKVILSDIAVHYEQNPERGLYFKVNDPLELAAHIKKTMNEFDQVSEDAHVIYSVEKNNLSREKFAREYQQIVLQYIR